MLESRILFDKCIKLKRNIMVLKIFRFLVLVVMSLFSIHNAMADTLLLNQHISAEGVLPAIRSEAEFNQVFSSVDEYLKATSKMEFKENKPQAK